MAKLALLAFVIHVVALPASGSIFVSSGNNQVGKNRPVTKVITLLKDMLKQLEKEAEEDEEIYEKMECWCQTNDKEKSKAVKDAEARISDLTSKIEELTANSARLSTQIANLEKEVAKNQQALDQAGAIRQKQQAAFNAEEKDMLESISALKSAVVVLSKHHTVALQEVEDDVGRGTRALVEDAAHRLQFEVSRHEELLKGVLTRTQRRELNAFLQGPASYSPQSGQIFGILKEMKRTFEEDLSASQKQELADQKAYEELKSAKQDEINAGQAQIDAKMQELARTDEKNAQSKQDIDDTRSSLTADEEFLMDLKQKCSLTDKEWEERTKTRQAEMEAVSKALAVLSSDDAHDTFTKTFNPSFLSKDSTAHSDRRLRASKLLLAVAKKVGNPRLSTLASQVQLDAFERVKKAIDNMVVQLAKEKQDEIQHKDFCVDEFNSNQLQTEKKVREKADVVAKIGDLDLSMKQLAEAVEGLQLEVTEMQTQLKRAGEDREKQNKDFQMTIMDQRETQKLLQQALNVLQSFYAKKAKVASLIQQPAGFKEYSKNAGAGGVMGLLEQIMSDAKAMEKEAIQAEEDSQKAYEGFVKDTNDSIEAKNKDIVGKTEGRAKAEKDLVRAKEHKEGVLIELEQLSNYDGELHGNCDFIIKNFEMRQTARDEEIEALKQAKAILSGAKFAALLQGK